MQVTEHSPSPLVSVIVPTYNRARYVSDAVRSVEAQSWRPIELIVADDGSTDGTEALFEDSAGIRYVRQPNLGQGAARNLGLRHSTGEFVATLDSDDLWDTDFVARCMSALLASGASVACANYRIDERGTVRPGDGWVAKADAGAYGEVAAAGWVEMSARAARRAGVRDCLSPSSGMLVRRDALGDGWDARMRIGDDWAMLVRLLTTIDRPVVFTRDALWTKRAFGDNVHDGQEFTYLSEHLFAHDVALMLRTYWGRLDRDERADLMTKVRYHRTRLCRAAWRANGGRPRAVLMVLTWLAVEPAIVWPIVRGAIQRKLGARLAGAGGRRR